MAKREKQVDAYIARAAGFAKPILEHFRELVHKNCPEAEEKIKWGMPYFDYKGSIMCGMAAFKQHCAITFSKAALFSDPEPLLSKAKSEEAMGHLGKITSLGDLPKDSVLSKYIKEAMKLNEAGIKLPARKPRSEELPVPDYFMNALKKNKAALSAFNKFPPSHRREYVSWITEAKTEATRLKRLSTALEWISEGKGRNWKYEKK